MSAYDPPAALEGPNSGLTEQVADWIWSGRPTAANNLRGEHFHSISAKAQENWRVVARHVLKRLADAGFCGPGGPPRPVAEGWSYAWLYEGSKWEIIEEGGDGAVALVCNPQDVPLLVAAPRLLAAAEAMLAAFGPDVPDALLEPAKGLAAAVLEALGPSASSPVAPPGPAPTA